MTPNLMVAFDMSGAVTTALGTVVDSVTEIAGAAAPVVLGSVAVIAGINIGLKLFKRFANKAA